MSGDPFFFFPLRLFFFTPQPFVRQKSFSKEKTSSDGSLKKFFITEVNKSMSKINEKRTQTLATLLYSLLKQKPRWHTSDSDVTSCSLLVEMSWSKLNILHVYSVAGLLFTCWQVCFVVETPVKNYCDCVRNFWPHGFFSLHEEVFQM